MPHASPCTLLVHILADARTAVDGAKRTAAKHFQQRCSARPCRLRQKLPATMQDLSPTAVQRRLGCCRCLSAVVLVNSEKDEAMCASLFCLLPVLPPRPDLMESRLACGLSSGLAAQGKGQGLNHAKIGPVNTHTLESIFVIRTRASPDLAKGPARIAKNIQHIVTL